MDGRGTAGAAYAGVDTHKDTHMLGLIDALGRELGTWEFPATQAGCEALARAIGDASIPVGVEGTRSYGANVAHCLSEAGFAVYEVIRPRREQRRRGKADALDAISAARNVARGCAHPVKDMSGGLADMRAKLMLREQYLDAAKRAAQRIDALVVTAPAGTCEKYRRGGNRAIAELAKSRPRDEYGKVLRELARVWAEARKRADALESELAALARAAAPALIGASGVGAINAAKVLVAVGANPERIQGEAGFAMLAGTAPIPASSGRTDRHRLNRGGNRQLNCAIHSIAIVRMSRDERTRAYVAKKMAQGKTKREAVRCLCRYISREVYGLLRSGAAQVQSGPLLAERRRRAGLTQRDVAEAIGVHCRKVGRVENEKEFDNEMLMSYAAFLDGYAA